jgi:hypothetical protein
MDLKKLIKEWKEYKEWCSEQITNRWIDKFECVPDNPFVVKVSKWIDEKNMIPTFDGFMDYLTKKLCKTGKQK